MANPRREDVHLARVPELERLQTERCERGVPSMNENPWQVVQVNGGWTASDGGVWLPP